METSHGAAVVVQAGQGEGPEASCMGGTVSTQ